MLIVQKYGGSSLADPARIYAAAQRAIACVKQGNRVIMVVSAQADTTDELITAAHAIDPQGPAREMDMYLSVGEQLCAALTAMAIRKLGYPAVSLTGWQAGILTDCTHGNARIIGLRGDRILRELANGSIAVVTGFQGISTEGNITTLGRGGSDTTAVALAAFLQADMCQIFTDVDGVYDRDPRRFADANRFDRISYEHMLELIRQGAQVLHDRSVEFARSYGIQIEVLSSFTGAPGTIVGPEE